MPPRPSRLFHGTASTYLPAILKEGLRPGGDGVVYLTDTQAIGFARMAVHRANMDTDYRNPTAIKPVVLEIDATRLAPGKLKAFQRPASETIGTVEVLGGEIVPPNLIRRTALIDPVRAPEMWRWAWDSQVARGFMEKARASDDVYDATCKELRNLILWLFNEEPAEFSGPPERERAGIEIIDLAVPRRRAQKKPLGR
jgi:hypothetical protein